MTSKPTTLEAVSKRVQSLKDKQERTEKEVHGLKDVLNIHDNWNAEIRQLIGKAVNVHDTTGHVGQGVLKWSDRYNVCVVIDGIPRIYNKGGIVWIEPTTQEK